MSIRSHPLTLAQHSCHACGSWFHYDGRSQPPPDLTLLPFCSFLCHATSFAVFSAFKPSKKERNDIQRRVHETIELYKASPKWTSELPAEVDSFVKTLIGNGSKNPGLKFKSVFVSKNPNDHPTNQLIVSEALMDQSIGYLCIFESVKKTLIFVLIKPFQTSEILDNQLKVNKTLVAKYRQKGKGVLPGPSTNSHDMRPLNEFDIVKKEDIPKHRGVWNAAVIQEQAHPEKPLKVISQQLSGCGVFHNFFSFQVASKLSAALARTLVETFFPIAGERLKAISNGLGSATNPDNDAAKLFIKDLNQGFNLHCLSLNVPVVPHKDRNNDKLVPTVMMYTGNWPSYAWLPEYGMYLGVYHGVITLCYADSLQHGSEFFLMPEQERFVNIFASHTSAFREFGQC
ncbi:hypothetical protein BCR33DRAFT_283566 [Rhizoclosmatium globosum]|uniref:Uncharacterized protein n=1 Tax=Rhizoclosmatium globosum TaxID=329046 RepID=A0A1Y2C7H4_9FUNG|nr:hypothetical protein BCR33DRAFT_283566 [Rhizoclosmatium globosum]|eukprot:ORY42854.1 hypothetical protein BCR33DRAFT_283566 [Rhizoclosmatium globosum]